MRISDTHQRTGCGPASWMVSEMLWDILSIDALCVQALLHELPSSILSKPILILVEVCGFGVRLQCVQTQESAIKILEKLVSTEEAQASRHSESEEFDRSENDSLGTLTSTTKTHPITPLRTRLCLTFFDLNHRSQDSKSASVLTAQVIGSKPFCLAAFSLSSLEAYVGELSLVLMLAHSPKL